jgi:hypothetical protein
MVLLLSLSGSFQKTEVVWDNDLRGESSFHLSTQIRQLQK